MLLKKFWSNYSLWRVLFILLWFVRSFQTLPLTETRPGHPFSLVAPWARSSGETVGHYSSTPVSLAPNTPYRAHHLALACMVAAAADKKLAPSVLPVLKGVAVHLTLVSVANQLKLGNPGHFCSTPGHGDSSSVGTDPMVLFDVLAEMIAADDKDLCRPARFVLKLVFDTAEALLGSILRVSCRLLQFTIHKRMIMIFF